jgi:hypothetical protein
MAHPLVARVGVLLFLTAGLALPCAAEQKPRTFSEPGSLDGAGAYKLSADELKLDCKRMTGRMKVRILQMREARQAPKTSELSRNIHGAVAPIAKQMMGGTSYGSDPDGQYARDLAMLHAYNRQLAAKSCRTLDIEAELKPDPARK